MPYNLFIAFLFCILSLQINYGYHISLFIFMWCRCCRREVHFPIAQHP